MKKKIFATLVNVALLQILPLSLYAQPQHTNNFWPSMIIFGHISDNSDYFFVLENHLRMQQQNNWIRQDLLRGAIGKQMTSTASMAIGLTFIPSNTPQTLRFERRLWQHLLLRLQPNSRLRLHIRNRLEQRRLNGAQGTSWRHRIRLLALLCHKQADYCPLAYSETFLSINSIPWSGHSGLSQQRWFLGLQKKIYPHTTLSVGYLNQRNITLPFRSNINVLDVQLMIRV